MTEHTTGFRVMNMNYSASRIGYSFRVIPFAIQPLMSIRDFFVMYTGYLFPIIIRHARWIFVFSPSPRALSRGSSARISAESFSDSRKSSRHPSSEQESTYRKPISTTRARFFVDFLLLYSIVSTAVLPGHTSGINTRHRRETRRENAHARDGTARSEILRQGVLLMALSRCSTPSIMSPRSFLPRTNSLPSWLWNRLDISARPIVRTELQILLLVHAATKIFRK